MPSARGRRPTPGQTGNRLLDRLAEEEFARLAPSLTSVPLELKQTLSEADRPVREVYFPTSAMVSMLVVMEEGGEVETALIGAEGLVGLGVALGIDVALQKSIC